MKQFSYDIIYGVHPVLELIKARKRKIIKILIAKPTPKPVLEIIKLINRPTEIAYVEKNIITKHANTEEHQGILAYTQPFIYKKDFFTPEKEELILLIDNINDVRNLGALLRSAYCTNIKGVILGQSKTTSLTSAAFKSSAGLAEYMNIYLASSSTAGANLAKSAGYHLYVANFGGTPIDEIEFKKPACIVIGSEGQGVTKQVAVLGTCVTLPQVRHDISYNASVAGAIMMFYASRNLKMI